MALVAVPCAHAAGITYAADDLRTGWYPDQSSLSPQLVTGGTFGQLFSANVTGQVYAQPLVSNGTLFVATEANWIYGLDPKTGAQQWTRNVGTPFNPADLGCADLTPSVGITGTPVIDPSTNTAYFFAKRYASGSSGAAVWEAHAVDVSTGAERTGFPVQIAGNAQNLADVSFDATHEMQRPGLLLMNGVVYAAFGGHCDHPTYQGWVVGVSTSGQIASMWASGPSRAGIWQSGGGLASDGSGQILLSTGNGSAPSTPTPGSSPPSGLGEAVVRVAVQADGTLKATDFFAPYDATQLDLWDGDLGSGAPVALPSQYFGTSAYPNLMTITGKEGYVYLLDRANLGGMGQGPSGGDLAVSRIGPYGGVWSRPAVWPGDGGYLYEPTASPTGSTNSSGSGGSLLAYKYGVDGSGRPSLALAGTSTDTFGFGSGAPVVTSDGTTSGSAIVWILWGADGTGANAQLRAYSPVPVGGHPSLLWSAPVGTSTKFASPGVAFGRLYVGTRDGHVRGFGAPVSPPLSGSAVAFPTTTEGQSSQRTATFTANETVTVNSASISGSQFSAGTPSPALPATVSHGQTVSIPVTFHPSSSGPASGTLTVHTSDGDVAVGLSGTGQSAGAELTVSPELVSFGGTPVGGHLASVVTFSNTGGSPLTVDAFDSPAAPFSASGAPASGSTLAPGQSVDVTVGFQPTSTGSYTSSLGLETSAGTATVNLSGAATTPPHLVVSPGAVDFGDVASSSSATASFTLTNTGGGALTITKSKPPVTGPFTALTALDEGTVIPGGGSVTETVRFTPPGAARASDAWLITGNDGSGQQTVGLTGNGVEPAAPGSQPPPAAGAAQLLPGLASAIARAAGLPPALGHLRVGRRRISFTLSDSATVRFVVERRTRVPHCVGRFACARFTRVGRRWSATLGSGPHKLRFRGRPSAGGDYRLVATPSAAHGDAGPTRHVSFSVR